MLTMLTVIEGKEYYPLRVFAKLVNKSEGSLRYLMFKGNRIRKLKYIEAPLGKYNIPIEEYHEFPFTSAGRYATDKVYHFNKEGELEFFENDELQRIYKEYNVGKENKPKKLIATFNLEGVK